MSIGDLPTSAAEAFEIVADYLDLLDKAVAIMAEQQGSEYTAGDDVQAALRRLVEHLHYDPDMDSLLYSAMFQEVTGG